AGRVADILGRRRVLLTGLLLFSGTGLVCGLMSSAAPIVGLRLLQGAGAAMIFPVTIAVITNVFPASQRARAIGLVYGLGAVGTAAGPFVSGLLVEQLSWRWVFFVVAAFAAITVPLVLTSVPESRDETVPRRVDLPGLVAIILGIAVATASVDRGPTWGWTSVLFLGGLVLGVALLIGFVGIERRVSWPLVDLALFRNSRYVMVTTAGTVANICYVVAIFASTLYLQEVRGLSPIESGVVFLAPSVGAALAGPASGWLAPRLRPEHVMALALAVGGAGVAMLSADAGWAFYAAAFAITGVGLGLGWSFASVGTQAVVRPERAGEASGVTLTVVIATAGLMVVIAASVLEVISGGDGGAVDARAVEDVLRSLAVLAAAVASGLVVLARRHSPASSEVLTP
ncbi:MAG: MFS transporter, partial [Acidimicrobiia bacterium]